jgi:hypothetical protein
MTIIDPHESRPSRATRTLPLAAPDLGSDAPREGNTEMVPVHAGIAVGTQPVTEWREDSWLTSPGGDEHPDEPCKRHDGGSPGIRSH